MMQFPVQVDAFGQGLSNLRTINFAKALSQAVHRHSRRAFAQAQTPEPLPHNQLPHAPQ